MSAGFGVAMSCGGIAMSCGVGGGGGGDGGFDGLGGVPGGGGGGGGEPAMSCGPGATPPSVGGLLDDGSTAQVAPLCASSRQCLPIAVQSILCSLPPTRSQV